MIRSSTDTRHIKILDDCIDMANLSAWIYNDDQNGWPADPAPLDDEVVSTTFIGNTKASTQGAAIATRSALYLVFRGSQSILTSNGMKDWLTNLNFLLRSDYYGINAHRGFVKATMPTLKQIRELLEINSQIKRIYIGGHSLGGVIGVAVAVAVNNELRRARDYRYLHLITLGQPRFSRKRQLNLALQLVKYYRVQNGSDIVPRKPVLGYSHAGRLIYTSNGGELMWDPPRLIALRDRLFTFRQRLSDHSAWHYLAELVRHRLSLASRKP